MIKKAELYTLINQMDDRIKILENLVNLHETIAQTREGSRKLIFFPIIPFVIPWGYNKYDEE